jgi:regulatory protein
VERRLLQAGFPPEEVAEELARLEGVALIDDEAFARAVAEHAFGTKKQGRRAVAGKLAAAGVASETSAAVLDELGGGEQSRAEELARSRAARLSGVSPERAFTRLYGVLARRGYPPGVAREAARKALALEAVED